jgi:phosphohistidine phosphatase
MKIVYLLRHGKASKDSGGADFDRPLVKSGLQDVKAIAKRFKKIAAAPEVIISSPAKRAMETATAFAKAVNFKPKKIVAHPAIYENEHKALLKILKEVEDKADSVVLVGHNPSLNDLAAHLLPEFNEDIPAGALVGINLNIEHWGDLGPGDHVLILYERPEIPTAKASDLKPIRKYLEAKIVQGLEKDLRGIDVKSTEDVKKAVQKSGAKIAKKFLKTLRSNNLGAILQLEKSARKSPKSKKAKA